MDPKTVYILSSMLHVIVAGALWHTWRMNREIPGTLDWALAALFVGIGTWLLILVRTDLGLYAGIASKMALIYGLYRLWRGTRRFYGRWVPEPLGVGFVAIAVLASLISVSVSSDAPFAARLFISGPAVSVFLGLMSYELARPDASGKRTVIATAAAVAHFAFMSFTLYRVGITAMDYPVFAPDRTIDMVQFLGSLLLTAYVSYVLILLTTDRLHQNLRRQATIDPLTGAFNRRAFHDLQGGYLAQARREGSFVGLSMVDLDRFKAINDQYGHAVGDAVLEQTVQRLKETLRLQDIVARFGGEEFVILHPQTSLEDTQRVAERVRAAIEDAPFAVGDTTITVTASIGVTASQAPENIEDLTKAADLALYDAKAQGRNRVIARGI